MFQKIYDILVSILGESKQGYYSSDTVQYQFCCPFCADDNGGVPDGKYNLEVNMTMQKYHCWKCSETNHAKGNVGNLIKRCGNSELYQLYKDEIKALKEARLFDIDAFSGNTIDLTDEKIFLPETFKKIDLLNIKDKSLIEYLNKRKIDQTIIDTYNIGYTTWEDSDWTMRKRIVIPSYDSFGNLNYYVGRDYTGKSKAKYKNCTADKKDIIFQESVINWDADIVLVEGAIDQLYYKNAVSMLGKSLTKDCLLYNALMNKCNARVFICLDADTDIEETKRIYRLLNNGKLRNKICYIRLDSEKDFGDIYEKYGKVGIIKTLKSIKKFNDIDLIF